MIRGVTVIRSGVLYIRHNNTTATCPPWVWLEPERCGLKGPMEALLAQERELEAQIDTYKAQVCFILSFAWRSNLLVFSLTHTEAERS